MIRPMSTIDLIPAPTRPHLRVAVLERLPRLTIPAIGVLLLSALIAAQAAHGFTDPDYWWHFKTGEYIVAHHSVPHTDVFGATGLHRSWVAHEWLAEVVIYLLVRIGGYGAALAVVTLSAMASIWLLARLLFKEGVAPRAALPILGLSAAMLAFYGTVRPQVLSWLMFAVLLSALYGYRAGRIHALWGLPVLFLLWANLHLSFFVGLAMLGLFVAATAGNQLIGRQPLQIRHLLLVLLTSTVATCINPNGIRLLFYPLTYLPLQATQLHAALAEYHSPDFHSLVFAPFGLALAVLLLTGLSPRKLDLWALGLGILTVVLGLQAARYMGIFAVAFVPLAGIALRERWSWAIARTAPPLRAKDSAANWVILAGAVALLALILRPASWSEFQRQPRTAGESVPVEAVNVIEQQFPTAHVFNQYEWGGYLMYRRWPEQSPFVDGREDMFSPRFLDEYFATSLAKPGWQDTLDRYGVNLVLIRSDSPMVTALQADPRWRLVSKDPLATVYVRS